MMFHFYEMKYTAKWNFIAYIYKKEFPLPFQAQKIFPTFEAVSKCFPPSAGSKVKKGKNYNRRNT